MNRFDDSLTFSHSRHIGLKTDSMAEIFRTGTLGKGLSIPSRMKTHHFVGSLVGNLSEAVLFQRNLALRLSDKDVSPALKHRVIDTLIELKMIDEMKRGYSFKTSSVDIPKHDLTKLKPNLRVLETLDVSTIAPSKAWSIVLRRGREEILVKTESEANSVLYKCSKNFQRRVNIPIRSFKRIFSGDIDSGGRIYSNYQQMSRESRSIISIDGEPTVELDFPYNQIRMLFQMSGVTDSGDPYVGFGIEREVVKKAMNTLINSPNPKRVFCDMRWAAPFRWNSDKADAFIEQAYDRYPILHKMEGSGIGLKLQKVEGEISLDIMRNCLHNNDVVLPIHDSFIVKKSEAERFGYIMERVWHEKVGATKIC